MPESIIHANLEEKDIAVHVSDRAKRALNSRTTPLHVNMELYFSCFVKKIIHFSDSQTRPDSIKIMDNLFASFRTVQSKSCNIHDLEGDNKPTLIDLPVEKCKAIVPKHLFIDWKRGKWKGSYTWNLRRNEPQ